MDQGSVTGLFSFLSWAISEQTLPGESASGDISLVEKVPDGALIAVVDGLGHGTEAAKAAVQAEKTIRRCATEPLDRILEHTHQALIGTRGAVITLVNINDSHNQLTWVGVGNVEGRVWPAVPAVRMIRQSPPLRGGVVGHALPPIRPSSIPLERGDIIILNTDGISNEFHEEFHLEGSAQQIADGIMKNYWMGRDDALVLVARYLGSS